VATPTVPTHGDRQRERAEHGRAAEARSERDRDAALPPPLVSSVPPGSDDVTGFSTPEGDRMAEDRTADVHVEYDIKITPKLIWAIVAPYFSARFMEQFKALLPVSAFLFLFQLAVLRQGVAQAFAITGGLMAVVLGLMFFIEGIRLGVMPLGENIGATLPAKAGMAVILFVAFLLGTIATFAEPAVAALTVLGGGVKYENAPMLWDFLNNKTFMILLLAAAGVGLGSINGIVRFVRNKSLKVTIFPGLAICVALTLLAAFDKNASALIGVAWDAGGITTGTVTAPLVLALGVGMARALGKSDTGMSGFGIITLCSIWPIALVMGAALVCSWAGIIVTPEQYAALKSAVSSTATADTGLFALALESFISSCTSVLPLMAVLFGVQKFVLKEPIRNLDQIIIGIAAALIGLTLFKIGLVTGLNPLGDQVGSKATLAFAPGGGLYGFGLGKIIVLLFAFVVGYGASLAEPALLSLGITVEEVTAGAFKKFLVMHSVGIGVGVGLIIGVARILYGWSSLAIVLPSYALVLLLTLISDEKYVNIGWDSGGVTTGDITSPILIALGLGVAAAVGGAEGFSLIAMGSVWPIISVLALGFYVNKTTPAARSAAK
jgi:Protein of unknown function (DUF1538)